MQVSHISTKTSTYLDGEVQEAFTTLIESGTPFSIWIDSLGVKFPVPFIHGTCANWKVEKCVQDLIRREFGDEVHFI